MTDLFASTPEPTHAQLREAARDAVIAESLYVPSRDPGIELFVRNKRPAGGTDFWAHRTLLYVHGASYPASPAFDLALGGISLMDYIALRGWDVYCVDMRGYGHSTRPPAMDAPPEDNPPLTDTQTAADDVGAVVEYIQARRGIGQLDLMGWSWGTAIMGLYTSQNGANVRRLVEIGEATHAMLMEKNRMHFIREVLHFLEEPGGASD